MLKATHAASIGLSLSLGAPFAAAAATPPWCSADGLNPSERMICADAILGRLDVELNDLYDRARRVEPDLNQVSWLAERDACGPSIACLEEIYRSRIAELSAVAEGAEALSGVPDYGQVRNPDAITVTPLPQAGAPPPARPEQDVPPWWRTEDDEVAELQDLLREREGSQQDNSRERYDPPAAGSGRIAGPETIAMLEEMTPRPWCDAQRLNSTEQTICADPDLSLLDALLELVYGRTTARDDDAAQLDWLRSERDACGTDRLCIAEAYADRIAVLDEPLARAAERRHDIEIPAGHYPPPGLCRLWYPDRPPGHQPPPTSCDNDVPRGAVLVRG